MSKVLVRGYIGEIKCSFDGLYYWRNDQGRNDAPFCGEDPAEIVFKTAGYYPEFGGQFPFLKSRGDVDKVLDYLNAQVSYHLINDS